MFKNSNKPIGQSEAINIGQPLNIKKKYDDFDLKPKDNWSAKKTAPKPNPRLKAKTDLINEYYQNELINATQYNQFKEHLHNNTKTHLKKMLVEIHRNKKSFKEAHKIAFDIGERNKKNIIRINKK
tara:strand:- start:7747 stop:8124 length:378 start_codon:yes stop_codon:yes gene_type:complete